MGHRNPQGLYYDIEKNYVLETEHGPFGGDEVNLIEVDDINKGNLLNFGWAISSYGEHYGGKHATGNIKKYKKYPLYKSHSEHGFVEPIHAFVPSIGISEITKIEKNKYVLSSMKDKSLYFFNVNDVKKINDLERVEVFERVRDINFKDGKLYKSAIKYKNWMKKVTTHLSNGKKQVVIYSKTGKVLSDQTI